MSRFLCADYLPLVPYTPGEQLNDKKYVKLNTNESPFPPSPRVKEALNGNVIDKLNLYSDPTLSALTAAIGEKYGVGADRVFAGNGSDDVLAFSIMGFCGRDGELVCPDITYSFYPVYCNLFGVRLTKIPLREDFSIDPEDYIGIHKNIVIANPNAPTGLVLPLADIERIVASNPDNVVIIDEAYVDFCDESAVCLLDRYPNLIVTMTYSKSRSLAGLRVGYALSSPEIIADLNKIKFSFNPYNLNSLSIKAATAAIRDEDYYGACIRKIVQNREAAKVQLRELGFTVTDSKANFLFASHPAVPAATLYQRLKDRGVLVRYFRQARIDNYLRITVGSEEQMAVLMQALETILKE